VVSFLSDVLLAVKQFPVRNRENTALVELSIAWGSTTLLDRDTTTVREVQLLSGEDYFLTVTSVIVWRRLHILKTYYFWAWCARADAHYRRVRIAYLHYLLSAVSLYQKSFSFVCLAGGQENLVTW